MNFFQIFVLFAVIAAVNMEVHPKTRSAGSASGHLRSLHSGGSSGGSGHSGGSGSGSGGSHGGSGNSGSSHGGSRGGSGNSGSSHGGSHGGSGNSGSSHGGSHGGSANSGSSHGGSHGGSSHSGNSPGGSHGNSGHSGSSLGNSHGSSGHSGSSLGSSGGAHGGSSGNMGHSSSNSNSGNHGNSQAASANSGSDHNNIGRGTQNSHNDQKTTSNTAGSHSNGNGNINVNVGTSKVSGGKSQNSLGIDGSYTSKDGTGEIHGTAKQAGKKSSISADVSKQISVNEHTNVKLDGSINKESRSEMQNHIGAEATLQSKDGTGKISVTAEQNNRKSSIGADVSKQISVNEHTNVKLDGSIHKESSSKTQNHIGAEATLQSEDKTGKISAKVERNNDENSFNFRAEKNIIDNDRGSLNAFAEINQRSGVETKNIGIEGTLNSKDGTGKLKAGLSSDGGWHAEGEKNLYSSDKVSIDANAGIKQAAGGTVEGQVGIEAKIPIK